MNVPEEIVTEILSWLPVRSLIRFKCVCKRWNGLIDSQRFVDIHLNQQLQLTTKGKGGKGNNERIHIIRCNLDSIPIVRVVSSFDDFESLSRLSPDDEVEVPGYPNDSLFAGNANGIVCISDSHCNITLWNPALREFRVIPPRSFNHPPDSGFQGSLLFMGFGFDDTTNDYKVVCVERFVKDVNPPPPIIEVVQLYNLKTNSWRTLETTCDSVTDYSIAPFYYPTFFKGIVHWPVWDSLQGLRHERFISTFNMTTELFGKVHCPHGCELYYPYFSAARIFVFDNSTLSLVAYYQPADRHLPSYVDVDAALDEGCLDQSSWHVDVWVMNDYNVKDSWTKQYCVVIPECHFIEPLSFSGKDKLFLCKSEDYDNVTDYAFICYHLPTGGQQHRVLHYHTSGAFIQFHSVICLQSLVSIK